MTNRREISDSILFFHGEGIEIEEIIEKIAIGFHELKKRSKAVSWENAADKILNEIYENFGLGDKWCSNHEKLMVICEVTANYFLDLCEGKSYRNIYDFVAKTYPRIIQD